MLAYNSSLVFLDLHNCLLENGHLAALIIGLRQNHSLKKLNLRTTELGLTGARLITQALWQNKTLRFLDLSSNGLDDSFIPVLAELIKHNQGLRNIALFANHEIRLNEPTALIEALEKNTALECLSFPSIPELDETTEKSIEAIADRNCTFHTALQVLQAVRSLLIATPTSLALDMGLHIVEYMMSFSQLKYEQLAAIYTWGYSRATLGQTKAEFFTATGCDTYRLFKTSVKRLREAEQEPTATNAPAVRLEDEQAEKRVKLTLPN